DFSPYDNIYSPAVNPIDGTVYVAPFMHRKGGFITKEGAFASSADSMLSEVIESATNKYDSDGGISLGNEYGYLQGLGRPGSKPFYQPSGELTWPWTGRKWYDRDTSNSRYKPWVGFAKGNEAVLSFEPTSQYSEAWHTTIGTWYRYEGWVMDSMTQVAPDGSVYIIATHSRYSKSSSGNGSWIEERYVIPFTGESTGDLPRLLDDNTVEVDNEDWGGLFFDPNDKMRNQVLEFEAAVNDLTNNKTIGAAIQIQDEKNMYSVEWTKDNLTLYKVVKGQKSVLNQAPMLRSAGIPYSFKLEAIAGTIRVSVNGVKKLEATDSTYLRGSAGIMSIGQQQASFSKFKRTNYGNSVPEETFEAVLIGDQIDYKKLFNDPEADPKNAEEWSYKHDPNYFANPLGLSQYDGQMFGTTLNTLDKPGLFEITHRAEDKLNFASYQLFSEPVTKNLYVHRRPVAEPNVTFTGIVYPEGEALDYLTNDTSYDLDVTGRLADRLFRTRWADSNNWLFGERLLYNRPGVELIIQEQVKDLHGAWSFWGETRIFKEALPPVNQTKPRMIITVPDGTLAKPTVLITDPNVHWIYQDDENDPQEQYRLNFTYVDDSSSALKLQGIGDDLNYEVPEGSIDPGRVVKIQGQVFSKGVWSDDSNIVYFVIDMPPLTYLLSFNGPKASQPIYTNNNRPELRVVTVDPENDPIKYIDYEVFFNATGNQVIDTNTATAAANLTPSTPLQEGLHHWRARANDSYLWGPYSETGYFFVDTVRPDDVDEQLAIKPTSVTVDWNAFSDAAPSSGHASREFYLQKVNADRSVTIIDINNDGAAEYSIPVSNSTRSHTVNNLIPGQEYRLTVIDYDVAGNMGHYEYIYFVTNRPPTGDFTWEPSPVYEGDTVRFISDVDDPDQDELDVTYDIISPGGVKKTFNYVVNYPYPDTGPSYRMLDVGDWTVTMTVSDRLADPVIVTKTISVLPLKIDGFVNHTPKWDENRISYNQKNPTKQRPYEMFWAGEEFLLSAIVTNTGVSATKPDRVIATLVEKNVTDDLLSIDQVNWVGSMWQSDFDLLKDGNYLFTFKVYWNNGVIKTDDVIIQIKDSIWDVTATHRLE
ncbi:MAG: hypothetical protein ACE3L7_05160, partial [Candidatus Pristimantibacillus sp.]